MGFIGPVYDGFYFSKLHTNDSLKALTMFSVQLDAAQISTIFIAGTFVI